MHIGNMIPFFDGKMTKNEGTCCMCGRMFYDPTGCCPPNLQWAICAGCFKGDFQTNQKENLDENHDTTAHVSVKWKPCYRWVSNKTCIYGDDCFFLHEGVAAAPNTPNVDVIPEKNKDTNGVQQNSASSGALPASTVDGVKDIK